jgi:hypothetical protein
VQGHSGKPERHGQKATIDLAEKAKQQSFDTIIVFVTIIYRLTPLIFGGGRRRLSPMLRLLLELT